MKNYYRLLVAAFMAIAATSCSQFEESDLTPSDVNLVPMTISVGGETRTFIGEDGKTVNWCEDDRIAIFDGTGKREFKIVEGSISGGYAEFAGEVDGSALSFCAVYPFEAAGEYDAQNGVVSASVAESQVLAGKNVADGAIVAVGKLNKGEQQFQLKNAVGFFRVDVTFEDITSIIVEGEKVAGTALFNAEAAHEGELKSVSEGKNRVSLTPEAEVFTPGSYYVTMLPGSTPADEFKVTLTRKSGEALEMTSTKEVVIARNGGFFLSDYKLVKKVAISDAATLQNFLANAHTYTAGQEIEVVCDIDLKGVELVGATSFNGTLVGNNFSLLNWTSNGVSLFESLAGTVKNLKIDKSCSLTAADNIGAFGFIANTLETGGVVSYCENNADVTLTTTLYGAGSAQDTDAAYFGALVGKSFGSIDHSKNAGNITIATTPTGGDTRGIVYIGGVAGLIDTSAQVAAGGSATALSYCENSGKISYSINGRGGFLFMGGVAGGTTAHTEEDLTSVANVDHCVNTGEIYHTFTQNIIGAGNAKSNYINMAGVIGYCEGGVTNSTNGEQGKSLGKVQLDAPKLTSEAGYSAASVKVAGVSAYAFDKVENCNNYGFIDVDGSFGPGYTNYVGGGNVEDGGTFIAGVVSQVGAFDDTVATHTFTNCHNYGEMDIDLPITSAGTTHKNYHYVGGVVAYCNTAATNLTNNAAINVYTEGSENYLGGVVGYTDCSATTLTNNGDITYYIKRTGGAQINSANQLYGGVLGYNSGDKMTSLTNNNPVSVTIDNTNQKLRIGGVAGSIGNAEGVYNNAAVSVTDKVSHAKEIDLGGVAGASTAGALNTIYNKGKVTYDGQASTGTVYTAGAIGYSASTSITSCYNEQPVLAKATEFGSLYVAGVCGSAGGSMENVNNSNNSSEAYSVKVDAPTVKTLYLAGVTGATRSATTYTNVDNAGALYAAAGATLYYAGITGHVGGKVTFTNCDNSGAMTFAASELAATELNMAGICARPYAKSVFDTCTNSGAMSLTAKSCASKACYLGGIGAQTSNATSAGNGYDVVDCTVSGNITVDCPATWYIGGAAAFGAVWSSTTSNHRTLSGNTLTSDITLSSTTTEHHIGGIVGYSGVYVDIDDNSYSGTITAAAGGASKLNNIGGIAGTLVIKQTGSSQQNATFALSGNTVEANITCDATSYAGLMYGAINNSGTKNTSTLTCEFGAGNKVKSSSINGTAITADNYKQYLYSAYDGSSLYTLTVTGADGVAFE